MTYCRMSCLLMDWKRLTLIALYIYNGSTYQVIITTHGAGEGRVM